MIENLSHIEICPKSQTKLHAPCPELVHCLAHGYVVQGYYVATKCSRCHQVVHQSEFMREDGMIYYRVSGRFPPCLDGKVQEPQPRTHYLCGQCSGSGSPILLYGGHLA